MKLNRTLATAALALTATLAGLGATATAASAVTYDDAFYIHGTYGEYLAGSVDYIGTQSVHVNDTVVADPGGDAYCTTLKAAVYEGGRQLGNTITIGSVCNGGYKTVPGKTISVTAAAGQITMIQVFATRGGNGANSGGDFCYRATDSTNGNPHTCR